VELFERKTFDDTSDLNGLDINACICDIIRDRRRRNCKVMLIFLVQICCKMSAYRLHTRKRKLVYGGRLPRVLSFFGEWRRHIRVHLPDVKAAETWSVLGGTSILRNGETNLVNICRQSL